MNSTLLSTGAGLLNSPKPTESNESSVSQFKDIFGTVFNSLNKDHPLSVESTMKDPTFGEVTYDKSWSRSDIIDWWGKTPVTLDLTAQAYKNDGITKAQRGGFIRYKTTIRDVIKDNMDGLKSYMKSNHKVSNVYDDLTPTQVLFQRDGEWGVLFDSKAEPEHGISLYTSGDEVRIGSQDDFL